MLPVNLTTKRNVDERRNPCPCGTSALINFSSALRLTTPYAQIKSKPVNASSVTYTTASQAHVSIILALQAQNLRAVLTPEEIAKTGFITIAHELDLLSRMNAAGPAIIGVDRGVSPNGADTVEVIAGYCLMMPRSFLPQIPLLEDTVSRAVMGKSYKGRPISPRPDTGPRWFIMGQVLVAPEYRGLGVFDGMYRALRKEYMRDYDFVLTEVSGNNPRSLRAHYRVGFKDLSTLIDASGGVWYCIIWDWTLSERAEKQ